MPRKLFALLCAGILVLAGCTTPTDSYSSSPAKNAVPAPLVSSQALIVERAATSSKKVSAGAKLTGPKATVMLKSLPVKGKAAATGYNRNKKFGNGWKDFDGDKCDERQDTLSRDMSKVKFKDRKKCTVASGTLNDKYTNKRINWKVKSGSVDIDHVVALKNAWISGGQKLSQSQRQALANDPLNLIAADASANRQKGEKNTAEWLPKNKSFRCQYVATQISVKKKYALSVTKAEKNAMTKVLNTCKNQKGAKVTTVKPGGSAPKATPKKKTSKAPATVKGTVHPGSYCKNVDKGKRGKSKAGKLYTCKYDANGKLRWRV
ncbi:HNH endonuclease family protein [Glutamicibacter sp. JC586]|uniref:HNH endonuclease family protein n=1 Tax=Glutamicibacter sp. JC586 TaxID=2590552 RepID=UPI0013585407|nr:HNH endonuclease family protein [Glutamicibacter sp. JC586]